MLCNIIVSCMCALTCFKWRALGVAADSAAAGKWSINAAAAAFWCTSLPRQSAAAGKHSETLPRQKHLAPLKVLRPGAREPATWCPLAPVHNTTGAKVRGGFSTGFFAPVGQPVIKLLTSRCYNPVFTSLRKLNKRISPSDLKKYLNLCGKFH
jgi:hypothetical protein